MCASTAMTALWFQHSEMKPRFHHLLFTQCDGEIHHYFCGITVKMSTKAEAIFCILWTSMSISETHPVQNM
jgi:hypothetical protein